VSEVRARLYARPLAESLFDASGNFKEGHRALPPPDPAAEAAYVLRYVDFLGKEALRGQRLVVYQHSAVGRDLLPRILRELGAEVFAAGRSETFVPIDTENIDQARLASMQALVDVVVAEQGPLDALVSTDGDSDRPLLLGVDRATGRVRFFGGDLVGMVTAEFLGADAVVVPISCNDAIDLGPLRHCLEPKTRIGSPFVIAGMEAAKLRGKQAVCGWEANGGFLTGSDLGRAGKILPALPTRDAVLPIVAVLAAARTEGLSVSALFDRLPARFSRAALLRQFPRSRSQAIIARYSPADAAVRKVAFKDGQVRVDGAVPSTSEATTLLAIQDELARHFTKDRGFSEISGLDYTDGVRLYFTNGEVAHLRPSGNADELRIYAVADTQARADEIAAMAVREPDGLLPSMAQAITETKQ
jgi:phosphomannomutase